MDEKIKDKSGGGNVTGFGENSSNSPIFNTAEFESMRSNPVWPIVFIGALRNRGALGNDVSKEKLNYIKEKNKLILWP